MGDPVALAVIGAGGWGRNLIRNFSRTPGARLHQICDRDERAHAWLAEHYPGVRAVRDCEAVLADPAISAVAIATPGPTHYELTRRALLAGKDVFVEKPFVLSVTHARELIELAERAGRILMVGHLMEYHPVVIRLREIIASGELGEIHYIHTQRLNLGTVRDDENALWSFAPHDVSSILYMLGRDPTDVSARGQCCIRPGIEDVVFMSMSFAGAIMAHVHVSWLEPDKVRRMTIVGSRRMAVFDDLDPREKLRIYDKGAKLAMDYDNFAEYVGLRFGDINVPYIKASEPLQAECQHFIDCVHTRRQPLSDGHDGLRVVRVLEAAARSLARNGAPVTVE
jgi:predicted dehydrogenase